MDDISKNNDLEKDTEINNDIENEGGQTNAEADSKASEIDSIESKKEDLEAGPLQQEIHSQAGKIGNEENSASEATASFDSKVSDEAPKYSTSYTPPYYVPNFTVAQPNASADSRTAQSAPKPKKKRTWLIPVIAIVVVVALILVGCLGIGIGYIIHNIFNYDYDYVVEADTSDASVNDIGDETVTIIKNDGSIEVDEQLGSTGYSGLSVSEITALVADSVVEINTSLTVNSAFYGQYITSGAGSGVIIGEVKGSHAYYIITNHHVIDGADSITVRLRNGTSYSATVVGSSELDDIALLRIVEPDGKKLTTATLGKSANLKVGDGVVAIGNPLGTLGGTVTDGIISALDREIMVENNVMVLLQTNAAINPGNSGGGLFNSAGELIGVVNAKQSDTGIEGLGFAIPIDRASECVEDILEYGYVTGHPSLGVKVQNVSVTSGFSSSTHVQVTKAVANADLAVGDVICAVNGTAVTSIATFNAAVYQLNIGDEVTVQVIYKNSLGQTVTGNKTVRVIEYNPNSFS
ncbi:MAG: trypsin-like peptidase domain-containing protein [Clostridia bacterium]|nr:trypsin-like peptidase domain-containing protein [Clostridia bacterium]